ncbi:MAG: sigma-70 family RNA polymerase sigma factor [Bacillota bacterium]
MPEVREDISLITAAQQGDPEAIEYLINNNMDIVYAKAKIFFIKGLDKEDVIQEGRIGLYKAIRDYKLNEAASFRGFSQLCVHRQLISAIKKANRQKHIPLNNSTSINRSFDFDNEKGRSFSEILPDKAKDLEETLLYREVLSMIFKELEEELTDLEKEVFLHYLESRSYKEISDSLGVKVKAVDNALQRVRKKVSEIKLNSDLDGLVS